MSYPAPCLLGNRLNAFRLNYVQPHILASIDGVWSGAGTGQALVIKSLSISDRINEVPNTLIATVRGTKPVEGQSIRVTVGSREVSPPLFAGTLLRVSQVWAAENPAFVLYHIEATDPTWELTATLVVARYRSQSASLIAADLLTRFAPVGFVGVIQSSLPVIDEITFTNTTLIAAFAQLAKRIGGYSLCDYDRHVYLFTDAEVVRSPIDLTATHPSLAGVQYLRDLTQLVTRSIVEGGGVNALQTVDVGGTVLPVQDAVWYSPSGGYVRSGPQRIAYTGLTLGGAGSFAGSGTTPTTAPTLAAGLGASAVAVGVHVYAYTWVTAAGETLPSPLATINTSGSGGTPAPTPAPQPSEQTFVTGGTGRTVGVTYDYAVAWNYSALTMPAQYYDQTALSPLSAVKSTTCVAWSDVGGGVHPSVGKIGSFLGTVDTRAVRLNWYRLVAGSWCMISSVARADINTPSGEAIDVNSDAALSGDPTNHPVNPAPTTGNAVANRVTVTGIAPGPTGVTSRKVYRTIESGSQLKLHTTLADNTTTALASYDNTTDGSLGANAPTSDTAGLVQTSKLINAGSTTMLVTSTGPFSATGGFAIVGQQVIRYSGVSGTTLTGIPASGDGAIQTSIPYGTAVTTAPALTGIPASGAGSIVWLINRGDPVNLVVIQNDLDAQAALAALTGGDGVRESLLQDGRISLSEALARGQALLASNGRVRETLTHRSRDLNTRSGALVTIDLPPPTDIHGTFRIQDVNIGQFNARGLVMPTFDAKSSSERFTFEDLLRQVADTAPPPAKGD